MPIFARWRAMPAREGGVADTVSVVICCYNSAEVIAETVAALATQSLDRGRWELVIVDNNCTDQTVSLVQSGLAGSGVACRVVQELQPGLIHARKRGVSEAGGSIVLFVDDDNILEPDYLERLLHIYAERPEVGAVGSLVSAQVAPDTPAWFHRVPQVYACGKQAGHSGDVTDTRMTLFGAGLSFRSPAIRAIFFDGPPLFLTGRTGDVLLRGDDSELCLRCVLLGWRLWYDEDLRIRHNILPRRISWDYVLRAVYGGGVASVVLQLYKTRIRREPLPGYLPGLLAALRGYLSHVLRSPRSGETETPVAVTGTFLRGRLFGFLHFGRARYRQIAREIADFGDGTRLPTGGQFG